MVKKLNGCVETVEKQREEQKVWVDRYQVTV